MAIYPADHCVAGIVMGAAGGALFGARAGLSKMACESTNELLPFYLSMLSLFVIFLVMSAIRVWFDLAQTDVVLSDQRLVRRSIGAGFRHTWRNLAKLLASYVLITIVAAIILLGGIFVWMKFVPPASLPGAIFISQLTLLLLLIPRFWQRGVAVTYYLRNMVEPITVLPFTPVPLVTPTAIVPAAAPFIPTAPPEPSAS